MFTLVGTRAFQTQGRGVADEVGHLNGHQEPEARLRLSKGRAWQRKRGRRGSWRKLKRQKTPEKSKSQTGFNLLVKDSELGLLLLSNISWLILDIYLMLSHVLDFWLCY